MALKIIYTIFVGLLVVLFISLGISAFYPAPSEPKYPPELEKGPPVIMSADQSAPQTVPAPNTPETEEYKKKNEAYRLESEHYYQVIKPRYERNVSIITMIFAVIILAVSLTALGKIQFLSDGLLLGGVLSLLYAIVRGLMGKDNLYSFITVAVGLVVALILGYFKFIRSAEQSKKG